MTELDRIWCRQSHTQIAIETRRRLCSSEAVSHRALGRLPVCASKPRLDCLAGLRTQKNAGMRVMRSDGIEAGFSYRLLPALLLDLDVEPFNFLVQSRKRHPEALGGFGLIPAA